MNLLAQLTPSDVGKGFATYISTSLNKFIYWGLASIVIVLILTLVFQFLKIVRHRRWPRLLFYDLAAMHRLPRSMQRRLVHIASTHKLGDPARLFVCPDLVSRIESLEISQAAHEKERKRLEEFFALFKSAAFGEAPSDALSGKGGSK